MEKKLFFYKIYFDYSETYCIKSEPVAIGEEISWRCWLDGKWEQLTVTKCIPMFKTCAVFRTTELDDNIIMSKYSIPEGVKKET